MYGVQVCSERRIIIITMRWADELMSRRWRSRNIFHFIYLLLFILYFLWSLVWNRDIFLLCAAIASRAVFFIFIFIFQLDGGKFGMVKIHDWRKLKTNRFMNPSKRFECDFYESDRTQWSSQCKNSLKKYWVYWCVEWLGDSVFNSLIRNCVLCSSPLCEYAPFYWNE